MLLFWVFATAMMLFAAGGVVFYFTEGWVDIAALGFFYLRVYMCRWFNIGFSTTDKVSMVAYYRGDERYIVAFPKRRGAQVPLKIQSLPLEEDITKDILPFMGPYYDFHNVDVTPAFFKLPGMRIIYTTGAKSFAENEKITTPGPIQPDRYHRV